MLFNRKFKMLTMFSVSTAIGVLWYGMRGIVLFSRNKLFVVSFLKLEVGYFAKSTGNINELPCDGDITFVITANFGD